MPRDTLCQKLRGAVVEGIVDGIRLTIDQQKDPAARAAAPATWRIAARVATSAFVSALSQVAASWNQHCAPPSNVVSCSSIIGAGVLDAKGLPIPLAT